MSENVSISLRTLNRVERILTRVHIMLNREQLAETVSEEEAAKFMGYENIKSFQREVNNGFIPRTAYVELLNGKRRFYLDKLVKKG